MFLTFHSHNFHLLCFLYISNILNYCEATPLSSADYIPELLHILVKNPLM